MRAALIGCGEMSRAWLDAARAERRAQEFGLAGAVIARDVHELLTATRPDVLFDVVIPAARHEVVRAALQAGCHVLSEKPLADTLAHAHALVRLAQRVGRLHVIMQNRRYVPGMRRLCRLIETGGIGEVTAVHCDFFKAPHFGGFREQMDHVLLLDMAIHSFDAARLLAGSDPDRVFCQESNPPNSWYRSGAAASALFTLPGGGMLSYRGSWCADGLPTSWESQWRIVGTKGSARWDGEEEFAAEAVAGPPPAESLFAATRPVEVPALCPADRIGGHAGVMRDFVEAVRNGTVPETASHLNLRSLEMVFGAIASAETGLGVPLDALTVLSEPA